MLTPTTLHFEHTKGGLLGGLKQTSQVTDFDDGFNYTVERGSWATATIDTAGLVTIGLDTFGINIFGSSNVSVNTLEDGLHTTIVTVKRRDKRYSTTGSIYNPGSTLGVGVGSSATAVTYEEEIVGQINVTVNVIEILFTRFTPLRTLTFSFDLDDALPSSQTINLVSNTNWTIDPETNTPLTFSQLSGDSNVTITVGVDENHNLGVGSHQFNIPLNGATQSDTNDNALIPGGDDNDLFVTLNITDVNNSGTITFSKRALSFNYRQGGSLPASQQLSITASQQWVASAKDSWVNVSPINGAQGEHTLQVSIVNANLQAGVYESELIFTLGNVVRRLTIYLTVSNVLNNEPDTIIEEETNQNQETSIPAPAPSTDDLIALPKSYYFSDDNNEIIFEQTQANTYLEIDTSAVFNGTNYVFNNKTAFINGLAKIRVGKVAELILQNTKFKPFSSDVSLIENYTPISLNLTLREVVEFENNVIQEFQTEPIIFLKGTRTNDLKICSTPNTLYLTKRGRLVLAFAGESTSTLQVSGAINKTFSFTNTYTTNYAVQVDLAKLGNFNTGDSLNFSVSNQNYTVLIIPENKEQNFIHFQNEWGVFETIEFKGGVTFQQRAQKLTDEKQKDFSTYEKEILDVNKNRVLSLNTGWVYNYEAILQLDKLISSKKMLWEDANGNLLQVICTTQNIELYKTDKNLNNFTLEFEEVTNEKSYTTDNLLTFTND